MLKKSSHGKAYRFVLVRLQAGLRTFHYWFFSKLKMSSVKQEGSLRYLSMI